MKTLLVILFIFCNQSIYSQQRLGIDLGLKFFGINANAYYQRVLFKHFLFSSGLILGNYGKNYVSYHRVGVEWNTLKSPFTARSNELPDTTGVLHLRSYSTKHNAIGVTFGLGYFKEISMTHGVRLYLNSKFIYSFGRETMVFGNGINGTKTNHSSKIYVACISPEIVHTIRLSSKTTFLYGIKIPYYFSLDKGKFNPQYNQDTFYKIEPELTIGLTRIIGKCDK